MHPTTLTFIPASGTTLLRTPRTLLLPLRRPGTAPRHRPRVRSCHTPTAPSATADSLAALRAELSRRSLHAFIIPTSDPHTSEYAPDTYARRAYISSFTGSAGTAVVTQTAAYLWTDGRYYLQAEQQLPPSWTLMRAGLAETPEISDFLASTLPPGSAVGIDPFVHAVEPARKIRDALEDVGSALVSLPPPNPVDVVWGDVRPPLPVGRVRRHDERFAGQSVPDKLAELREQMTEKGATHVIFSMLDEVGWVFNVRGDDIPHCPVVLAYARVSLDGAAMYVDEAKVGDDVRDTLAVAGVEVRPYEQLLDDVREIAALESERIWLDPASTSVALSEAAGDVALSDTTPVMLAKACKNEAELTGMREAHIRDGVALSSFLCWLEDYVKENGEISEVDAAAQLEEFRAQQDGFLTTSFDTIAGSGPNGAIIHYFATPGQCGMVNRKDVFLLDSGGQYEDGTTDVTRTMHLGGNATDHEKECYTRVLQGHIGIDTAVFPEETTGLMLDSLARVPLWSIGLDYRHGTGHGVGACLNVHEGPHSISPRAGSNKAGLKAGMIVSNEPGYYEDGSFGIRIENLLIVVKKNTQHGFGGKAYLGFERLTHTPIDKSMIVTTLLSEAEIRWVDKYHDDVWQKLSPRMNDGRYKDWLWVKTRPLCTAESNGAPVEVKSSAAAAGVQDLV